MIVEYVNTEADVRFYVLRDTRGVMLATVGLTAGRQLVDEWFQLITPAFFELLWWEHQNTERFGALDILDKIDAIG